MLPPPRTRATHHAPLSIHQRSVLHLRKIRYPKVRKLIVLARLLPESFGFGRGGGEELVHGFVDKGEFEELGRGGV